jgi:hypothetical protein
MLPSLLERLVRKACHNLFTTRLPCKGFALSVRWSARKAVYAAQ